MNIENYISLLFDTYKDNKEFYKHSLIRTMDQAKQKYLVGNYEFLKRSLGIVKNCKIEAEEVNQRFLEETYSKIEYYKNTESQAYHVDLLNKHKDNEPSFNYKSINKQYSGLESDNIFVSDLKEIENVLNDIYNEVYSLKKDSDLDKNELLILVTFNNEVFKNELAFILFKTYILEFKGSSTEQAVFSFLFDAMTRMSLVHCTAPKFLKELNKYEIDLERIDSKQCYNESNSKTMTFKYIYKYVFGCLPVT